MANEVAARRVQVSGLKRRRVKRYSRRGDFSDDGIYDEDDVGFFFFDRGCDVKGVTLMVNQVDDCSQGYAILTLGDDKSVEKALALDGADAPDLTSKGGCLRVQRPKPAPKEATELEKTLIQEKNKTEDMEKDLKDAEARIAKLQLKIERQKARQEEFERLRGADVRQAEFEREKARQEEISIAQASLAPLEEELEVQLQNEEDRTRILQEIAVSLDGDDTKRNADAAAGEDPSFHLEEAAAGTPLASADDKPEELQADTEQLWSKRSEAVQEIKLQVKRTFLEYEIPKMEALVRTVTAPAYVAPIRSPVHVAASTEAAETEQESVADGAETAKAAAPQPQGPTASAPSAAPQPQGPPWRPGYLPRNVILSDLPRHWTAQTVRVEVTKMLARLWQSEGWDFSAQKSLAHGGVEEGIVVWPADRHGDANSGSCMVKLKRAEDAKWLAESGLDLVVGEGAHLKARLPRERKAAPQQRAPYKAPAKDEAKEVPVTQDNFPSLGGPSGFRPAPRPVEADGACGPRSEAPEQSVEKEKEQDESVASESKPPARGATRW